MAVKKSSPLRIHRAALRDARRISALIRRSADAVLAAEFTAAQLAAWKRHHTPALWRRQIRTRLCFVATRAGRLCGTITLAGDEVAGFYLSPPCRGQGIGTRLLRHLETCAVKRGHKTLWLTSSASARTFYLERGWRVKGTKTVKIRSVDFKEAFMTRRLPSKA